MGTGALSPDWFCGRPLLRLLRCGSVRSTMVEDVCAAYHLGIRVGLNVVETISTYFGLCDFVASWRGQTALG